MLKSGKKPSSKDVLKKEKHMRCLSHPIQTPIEKERSLKDTIVSKHRKPVEWSHL
jgi:hypothetical protein